MHNVVQRLEEAVELRDSQPGRLYPFSFSLGLATTSENVSESLEDLLHRADGAMYMTKRRKKQLEL